MVQACNFIKKEILAKVSFCEFCEISKNTFSYRTPLVAASQLDNVFGINHFLVSLLMLKITQSQDYKKAKSLLSNIFDEDDK